MKVWHCKKQGPSRTGIYQKVSAKNRTRSTSDNTKVALAPLLSDVIPVKFHFQIGK